MYAFPFNDENVRESEARRNIGDLFLLAARDMLIDHTHKDHSALIALNSYADVVAYDDMTQCLERDIRYMKSEHGAYPWWDGALFTEWLHKSGYYEQIGALVDTYFGLY